MRLNAPRLLPRDLLGFVAGVEFVHANCIDTVDALARLDDEDANIAVYKSDGWRFEVGLCLKCGHNADEGP